MQKKIVSGKKPRRKFWPLFSLAHRWENVGRPLYNPGKILDENTAQIVTNKFDARFIFLPPLFVLLTEPESETHKRHISGQNTIKTTTHPLLHYVNGQKGPSETKQSPGFYLVSICRDFPRAFFSPGMGHTVFVDCCMGCTY